MSSPCYSEEAPVSLSSPSTDSRGGIGLPYDSPPTPEIDQYAYENLLESQQLKDWPHALDYGIDGFGNEYLTESAQPGHIGTDFATTTAEGVRPEGSWLIGDGNGIDMPSIREATIPLTSEPFPHRMLAEHHAGTTLPPTRVLCNGCESIATITAQPGQLSVTIPVPAYCNGCLMGMAIDHANETLQRPVPIPKRQHRRPTQAQVEKPVFKCDIVGCTTTCKRSHDLVRHKRCKHRLSGVYYQCDTCGTIDYRDDKMREHCRKQHGQDFGDEEYREVAD